MADKGLRMLSNAVNAGLQDVYIYLELRRILSQL